MAFVALGFHASATAQTFTEYTIPTTIVTPNANSITPGPDGALWFTESGGNRIGRITTGGTITEFAIPTSNAFPFTITAGPDGALWFTEQDLNATKIGRITTAGAITEFSVPTANSQPTGIAAGSDGALWFTEANRNKIGRITTGGTITEFTLPGSFGTNRPFGITAGPDGALWYTVTGGNKIGRITTSGTVTEFALPNSNSGINYITTGPDGALWFTEQGAAPHRIGRMTTAGTVTEFPLPTTNGNPQAITTGPDGALWFAEGNLGQVGRISTSGTIKEFRSPGGGGTPTGAARGPDGNMWFTNGFKILKLPPPAATSTLVSSTLPVSRSVQVGKTATAFASIINTGSAAVSGCGIVPITPIPATFVYQTTDPKTNALTGTINTGASIAAGGVQTYVVAFTANAPFVPTDVVLGYSCTGVDAVVTIVGINTLLLTFDANPVPDVVAVGLTPTNDGFSHTGGSAGTGLFAIATSNVGTGGTLTTRVRLSDTTLPIGATLCQTNSTGGCLAPPSATVTGSVAANANQTFSVFLQAGGSVGADPARFRCFLEFVDSSGVVRGSTSTAVTTQ